MAWVILIHPEVEMWLLRLPMERYNKVNSAMESLEMDGPLLGRPLVDRIKGSKFHNLKELRPLGTAIRILFAFDYERRAVLLIAGDKRGNWKSWYEKNIPIAEKRMEEHFMSKNSWNEF